MLTYVQAIILGLIQGVTELFPVSSLGHAVLITDLFDWEQLNHGGADGRSPLLHLLVMLHVATALSLILFYRQEWRRICSGFVRSIRRRHIAHDSDAKLAWLLIAATIPAGLIGLVFEHKLRALFGVSGFAIFFLAVNGLLLIKGDTLVRKTELSRPRQRLSAATTDEAYTNRAISNHLSFGRALAIGVAQIGALFAGISRSGITMLAGLRTGLTHQDAARFSFLLATPIILLAGLYQLPLLFTPTVAAIRGPILAGSLVAGVAAYLSVRYLDKYFQNRSLRPFGVYCLCFAGFMLLLAIIRGAS